MTVCVCVLALISSSLGEHIFPFRPVPAPRVCKASSLCALCWMWSRNCFQKSAQFETPSGRLPVCSCSNPGLPERALQCIISVMHNVKKGKLSLGLPRHQQLLPIFHFNFSSDPHPFDFMISWCVNYTPMRSFLVSGRCGALALPCCDRLSVKQRGQP